MPEVAIARQSSRGWKRGSEEEKAREELLLRMRCLYIELMASRRSLIDLYSGVNQEERRISSEDCSLYTVA